MGHNCGPKGECRFVTAQADTDGIRVTCYINIPMYEEGEGDDQGEEGAKTRRVERVEHVEKGE